MDLVTSYINNLEKQQATNKTNTVSTQKASVPTAKDVSIIKDEFVKTKKNNGLIRKFYNFLKNKTNIGTGSKSVENSINEYENGKVSKKELDDKISKYKVSQENIVQTTGDVAVSAITLGGFFGINNFAKKYRAQQKLGATPEIINMIKNTLPEHLLDKVTSVENILKSKTKLTLTMVPILALVGGLTKLQFGQIERLTSKEFDSDKTLDKKERKADKKAKSKAKFKEDWKNFYTGAINGMLAPVTALAGGIVGVPAYLATMTGLRYATSKNDNEKKSVKGFAEYMKDNAVVNAITTTAIAIPAIKHANFSNVLGKNLEKVVTKLKNQELHTPDWASQTTTYQELEDVILGSPKIEKLLEHCTTDKIDNVIKELTNENIFAVKFLQIKNASKYDMISYALRENCPPTRTLEEAQEHINKMWGSADFTISKLLGVGTVAETYLAKDKTGKEVCIKVLKNGINAEKIAKDKEKFIKLVAGDTPLDKLSEDKKYLIKNIEDLANGISKEVDFVNEMNAAKELKKHCKVADVVTPIDAKPGIYVMEKAPGISVKTLADFYKCDLELAIAKLDGNQKDIEKYTAEIERIKSRSPEWENFNITSDHIKHLLNNYINLQIEQFSRIDKNGRAIHADIHPGNIFVNLESLKTGKGKLFTLIDTGNTINLSKEQSKYALRLTKFIQNGNVKDLSKIILDGAVLPEGLTKEEALQKIETDMRKCFFDSETKIDSMNIDSFYTLSDSILRKHGIIPNNTQMNLNKAKTSAQNSFDNLANSFFDNLSARAANLSDTERKKLGLGAIKDIAEMGAKQVGAKKIQETMNLVQMSPLEALEFLRNKNMLRTNSEDYLTFEMKQKMKVADQRRGIPSL
jgi:predicted unusual protein kinase regulating ubiquinone biosynthesis (AarF/ABC1/UbiB family)